MASGHVNRIQRPNTWLHRPACGVKKVLANPDCPHMAQSERRLGTCRCPVLGGQADIEPSTPEVRF
jgi:hypothetical protein